MNELFTLVAFWISGLFGVWDRRLFLARRAAVAGNAVLVDPCADASAEFFLELPEFRTFRKVVFQIVGPKDRSADTHQSQGDLLSLVFRNDREVRGEDQVDGVVFRKEQTPEQDFVGGTDGRSGRHSQFNALCVAFEGQTAAPFDHHMVELTRRMAYFEEMPQALPEPFFIGGFHRRSGLAFATAALTLIRSLLLRFLGLLLLLFLLLLTALLREIVDHAVRAGVDTQDNDAESLKLRNSVLHHFGINAWSVVICSDAIYWVDKENHEIMRTTYAGEHECLGNGAINVQFGYNKRREEHTISAKIVDCTTKDSEIIPFDPNPEVNEQGIKDFLQRYIYKPYTIGENVVGVEVNFNKEFYVPETVEPVDSILAEISDIDKAIANLEKELGL